ncbi:hypothetical protein K9N68_08075 [Kovacikia minuta CCNUW1]|uniref:hypothetical protein n=1 Tax=Kovacikia minuta TaxID=2931930 RepID=UPI001CD022D0|nr:hypothetical protein [Kovacikia minuta]UBF27849.1 hypothetical protein K9N68_08075 [Kovacikia minuta CCNUW1]
MVLVVRLNREAVVQMSLLGQLIVKTRQPAIQILKGWKVAAMVISLGAILVNQEQLNQG